MDLEQTVKKTIGNVWMFEAVVYALKTYFSKTQILQKKEKKKSILYTSKANRLHWYNWALSEPHPLLTPETDMA